MGVTKAHTWKDMSKNLGDDAAKLHQWVIEKQRNKQREVWGQKQSRPRPPRARGDPTLGLGLVTIPPQSPGSNMKRTRARVRGATSARPGVRRDPSLGRPGLEAIPPWVWG